MEFTLIAVTLLSLFLAISMGVVVWRLVREERRRSAARLAALAAELRRGRGAAGNEGPGAGFEPPPPPRAGSSAHPEPAGAGAGGGPRRRGSQAAGPVGADRPRTRNPTCSSRSRRRIPAPRPTRSRAAACSPRRSNPPPPAGDGWRPSRARPSWCSPPWPPCSCCRSRAPATDGEDAAPDGGRPPLDLIALDHAAEGPFLDIRGAVRNPPRAPGAERLSVVATAFDAAGTLVATRRAPVEIPSLPPGADSPFTVRLLAAGVSRYRISFLLDDATVPHVDRRPAGRPPAFTGDSS